MPHSITLSKITWSTPDGHTLLSDLDLTFGAERGGLIGRLRIAALAGEARLDMAHHVERGRDGVENLADGLALHG